MSDYDDGCGLIQAAGFYGMFACVAAVMGLVGVAGVYALATGEVLRLPLKEIGIGLLAVLFVSEVMAFGWVMLRLVCFSAFGGLVGVGIMLVAKGAI